MQLTRDDNGKFPAYAWPGGYPLIYILADGEVMCPDCANGENGSDASQDNTDPGWRLAGVDVHWEGPAECCAHCGAVIESAYGEPS